MPTTRARTAWRRPPLLDLAWPLRLYVVLVPLTAAVTAAVALPRLDLHLADLLTAALLVGCAAASVEASRRQGEPAGVVTRDFHASWWLPLALLLPPVYALLAPLPIMLLLQRRVRATLLHRRVFSAAAIGLAGATGSWVFHKLGGAGRFWSVSEGSVHALLGVSVAVGCAVLIGAINLVLVAVAVKASSPGATWSEILLDEDTVAMEATESSTGVLIAIACALHPALALLGLAPVLMLQRSLLHEQLRAAARTDDKTGLLNASAWERETASHLLRAARNGSSLAVLLLDLDHFKDVNDRHGHLVGDDVLRAVARTMREQLRGYDLPCRFGGEEFAVLLPDTDLAEAVRTAERLRERIAACVVLDGETPVRISASLGVAGLARPEQDVTELLAAADAALYRAKAQGRNRVCIDGQDGLDVAAS